jgi:hypothetical protein
MHGGLALRAGTITVVEPQRMEVSRSAWDDYRFVATESQRISNYTNFLLQHGGRDAWRSRAPRGTTTAL